jgi:formylglycine-generating enzyme required for sulfatase activity
MNDGLLESIFSVRSADDSNAQFGTAYVVRHDDATSYLVTCAHVVRAVGGEAQVLIGRQPATVVKAGFSDGADDLAVLATDRLAAPALPLAFDAERGRMVTVAGFRAVSRARRLLAAVRADATLGSAMVLDSRGGRTAAWQLVSGDVSIGEGFSGSPVVDVVTGEVIATAAYQQTENRVIAIAADALGSLWPDGLAKVTASRSDFRGIEFVYIPGSRFVMGTPQLRAAELARIEDREAFLAEIPPHEVELAGYYISRFPVTNRQYGEFIGATDHRVPYRDDYWSLPYCWNPGERVYPDGKSDFPVVLVSWDDALAFCGWLGVRLPTEAEWEKAASGQKPRTWPWGDTWEPRRCNTLEGGSRTCLPVGHAPLGESPYGVSDLSGNVWEWCSSLFDPYPYRADDGREQVSVPGRRVIRGGAWGNSRWTARCAARERAPADDFGFSIGFRVALSRSALARAG